MIEGIEISKEGPKGRWIARRNGIDSGPQKTKENAIRNLKETEMFIRIGGGTENIENKCR